MIDPEGAGHALRERYELRGVVSESDLEVVLAAERLTIDEGWPLSGRLQEVYIAERGSGEGHAAIRRGLSVREVRWLTAHALGHHTMHRTNRYILDRVTLAKREREAELFAGAFLLNIGWPFPPAWEIADTNKVPQDRVERWLGIRSGRLAVSAHWARA